MKKFILPKLIVTYFEKYFLSLVILIWGLVNRLDTTEFDSVERGLTPLSPTKIDIMKYDWSKERIAAVIKDCDSLS